MAEEYETLEIALFDNLNGGGTCNSCKTFDVPYIYCPIFILIMEDGNINFDETGETNRCELFSNKLKIFSSQSSRPKKRVAD